MPSAFANAPSSSGPVDAPVQIFTRKESPAAWAVVMRSASASGTALG